MARSERLLDRLPEEMEALLGHPVQAEAARLIAELVADLRTLRAPHDYYEFQRELGGHLYEAQLAQAEASRNAKRERAGRAVPTPTNALESWELEVVLWDRVVRQLRAVGDAMAWRLFNYDRRFIIALSRNNPPGPFVGKEGLGYELGAVKEAWERDNSFALLHDLTNSVRVGDMTLFTASGPRLVEVKKSAEGGGSRRRQQLRRAQEAVAFINEGAPLPGAPQVDLYVSPQQFKADLSALRDHVDRARREAVACSSIGHQQVLTVVALTAKVDPSAQDVAKRSDALKSRAFRKAGLDQAQHHLRGIRADSIGRDRNLAPFTIYPLDPAAVAALTTDLVSYEYVVGWDRLGRAFESHDFDVELLLEQADGAVPEDIAVLHDRHADRRITLHSGGLDQLLHELVDVDRFVSAVTAAARRSVVGDHSTAVLTFTNERAVWR